MQCDWPLPTCVAHCPSVLRVAGGGVLPLRCIDDLMIGLARSNHAAVMRFLWGQQGSKEEERAEGVETASQSRGAGLKHGERHVECSVFLKTDCMLIGTRPVNRSNQRTVLRNVKQQGH